MQSEYWKILKIIEENQIIESGLEETKSKAYKTNDTGKRLWIENAKK